MNLLDRIKSFKDKKVMIVGDIMIDHYIYGHVTRNSPDVSADKLAPVILVDRKDSTLGGAANVAANIASLGGTVRLYGIAGDDLHGKMLDQLCHDKGIIPMLQFSRGRLTTVKTRVIVSDDYRERIDEETRMPLAQAEIECILSRINPDLAEHDCVILSDYDKGTLSEELCKRIICRARELGKYVFVDPKPQNIDYFHRCTLVCPNKHEAEKISGIEYSLDNLRAMASRIKSRIGSDHIIITCSEDGMFCYTGPSDYHHTPTVAKDVVDISGAGDTALAGLALGMCAGLPPEDSAKIGNYAAGLVLAKQGTETVSNRELQDYVRSLCR